MASAPGLQTASTWPLVLHKVVRSLLHVGKGMPGLWRLRHRVLNYERVRFPEELVQARLSYGPLMWVRPNDPIGRAIFYDGQWEPAVITHFAKELRPGDVVLDVGANIGQFSLVAASRVGPSGKVFAIEAGSASFKVLQKNIETNRAAQVLAYRLAAWDSETTLYLGGVREDMLGWGKVQVQPNEQIETVPARPLDALLAQEGCTHVDVVKIDIEGAELKALRGMENLFKSHPPRIVYCEVANNHDTYGSSVSDLLRFFSDHKYQALLLDDAGPVPLETKNLPSVFNVTVAFVLNGETT